MIIFTEVHPYLYEHIYSIVYGAASLGIMSLVKLKVGIWLQQQQQGGWCACEKLARDICWKSIRARARVVSFNTLFYTNYEQHVMCVCVCTHNIHFLICLFRRNVGYISTLYVHHHCTALHLQRYIVAR